MTRRTVLLMGWLVAGCGYDGPTQPYVTPPPAATVEGLWTVSGNPAGILRLTAAEREDDGTLTAATVITTPSAPLAGLAGVAFDAAGTLWITSQSDSLLLGFAPAALARSGSAEATVVIRPARESLRSPTGLAFDGQGRLWVANRGNGTLVRYDPVHLATGGAPTPAATLTVQGQPNSLAFDAAGALWVSDAGTRTLRKFTPAQLAAGGTPEPAVVVSAAGLALQSPRGLAFDRAGNLWVANLDATIAAYSPAQLATSGAPEPRVVLTANGGALTLPVGLAFDEEGNLWVMGGVGTLTRYAPASLGVSGEPAPSGLFALTGRTLFAGIAFWPVPGTLPLASPRVAAATPVGAGHHLDVP